MTEIDPDLERLIHVSMAHEFERRYEVTPSARHHAEREIILARRRGDNVDEWKEAIECSCEQEIAALPERLRERVVRYRDAFGVWRYDIMDNH